MRILFLLRFSDKQFNYSYTTYGHRSSGLYNSAKFVSDMLNDNGFISQIKCIEDSNFIDKEIYEFKADIVILEGLFVPPSKLDELIDLYPNIYWVFRNHSKIEFLSSEQVAMEWIIEYMQKNNVFVSSNSDEATNAIRQLSLTLFSDSYKKIKEKTPLLMNYYPEIFIRRKIKKLKKEIHVGLFGAFRELKNLLNQTIAILSYANDNNLELYLHINSTRIEGANSTLINIKSIFNNTDHQLICHEWLDHHEFKKLMNTMDLCMITNFSETFSIISADAVSLDIPLVTNDQVFWVADKYKAYPHSIDDIKAKINVALKPKWFNFGLSDNQKGLIDYNYVSRNGWIKFLLGLY